MEGKGMIVCMSRRICVDLYDQIIKLRPDWHSDRDDKGAIKVVMTGSAGDPSDYQPHVRNKARRKAMAERFKDPEDPLKLVIVRDMWLTGFDAPPLHTMYMDKPMRGHGLMQAIARVNRVYQDKPGGLIVDYLGIAADLKEALASYTARERREPTSRRRSHRANQPGGGGDDEQVRGGAQFSTGSITSTTSFFNGSPAERIAVIPAAMEHILKQQDGKKRYMDTVTALSKAFALAVPHEEAVAIRDDVAFFQAVRAGSPRTRRSDAKTQEEMEGAIQQLVSKRWPRTR